MQKKSAKHKRNIKNLAAVTTLTAIILIVSTYAWFIGLEDVNVTAFDVQIGATEGLELSINGVDWFDGTKAADGTLDPLTNLTINEDNYNSGAYVGNTNSWTGVTSYEADGTTPADHYGLRPLSSSGQMDNTSSRLKLYEKSGLTSTDIDAAGKSTGIDWGYRLISDQVDNFTAGESHGYIAFDLFIRNNTETEYYEDVDVRNEEPIYLTTDSVVTVGTGGIASHGIQNSARIAFTQIGRMENSETPHLATLTGLSCADVAADDTAGTPSASGICREAVIWEPNDTAHSVNAIEHYETNCSLGQGATADADGTNTARDCRVIADGTAYPTYAITGNIASSHEVDIYDGYYNYKVIPVANPLINLNHQYETDADTGAITYDGTHVVNVVESINTGTGTYFTDSDKMVEGPDRPALMYLAPNSITKVRVYIWIEGQDIDNYDWASLGKNLAINFGFTKQQLSDDYIEDNNTVTP